jgi:DMSO reductase family type II enzyme heme b subunit
MPRSVIVGAALSLFAVNLAILVYAVWISRPIEAAHGQPAVEMAGTDVGPGRGTLSSPEPAPVVDDEYYDDEEDWAFEPIPVVNVFDIPSIADTAPVYVRHCAGCHGIEGRGDGPASEMLLPRPRDFSGSEFRYASSGSDRAHVLSDLERTIGRGVPRSAMPGFSGVLTDSEIAGLARYVLDIRERGEEIAPPAEGIDIGDRPPVVPALLARGKELFVSLSCNTCHGDSGRGDGMNAEALVDFQGRPVRPADFTSGVFKTGQTPEDLVRTVLRGVPGTPMVAYEAVLAQDNDDEEESVNTMDAWAVVAYIRSMARQPALSGAASGTTIVAAEASDEAMLSDPAHPAWLGIEPVLVNVKPLTSRSEQLAFIEVRAARAGGRLGICLDWRDATLNLSRGEEVYPDAIGAMFGLGNEVPALLADVALVDYGPVVAVNAWYWKADRQLEAAAGHRYTQITLEPGVAASWYRFVPGPGARLPTVGAGEGEAIDAGRRHAGHAVRETNARGLGGVQEQPARGQGTSGTAAWSPGSWRVVMSRFLETGDELDVQFPPDRRIPVAFAVWDGAKGDHGNIKLISGWHWIVVPP